MNTHTMIMGTKNLRVFRCNPLNSLGVGELTPYDESSLTPVSQISVSLF